MRWMKVVFVSAVALWMGGVEGCGGKVVIDVEGSGGNGLGGAGGGSSSSGDSSSGSSGNTCGDATCSGTPDGSCDCSATCSASEVKATCFATGGSFSCACTVDGVVKAKCEGPAGSFACDMKAGCCAEFFP